MKTISIVYIIDIVLVCIHICIHVYIHVYTHIYTYIYGNTTQPGTLKLLVILKDSA